MSTAGARDPRWANSESNGEFPSQPWENRTSRFAAHQEPSAVVVTAHGELDAVNAVALADYVQRCAGYSNWIILDLTKLKFFGTAGFSALHTINVRCAGAGVQWTVVPSPAVTRLLQICDPDYALPICVLVNGDSVNHEEPRRLLKLIPQPR